MSSRCLRASIVALTLALVPGCRGKEPGRRGSAREFLDAPVVIVSIDTLRADHLPAYGYAGVSTPGVDALRRDAILFENAYSHVPLTLPSHASLLTGLLPPHHGLRSNLGYRLDGSAHPTLARLLKARGYETGAAVSAWVLRRDTGLAEGFDSYDDALEAPDPDAESAALVRRPGPETVRAALNWVAGAGRRPFLLFVHLYEPHAPYQPAGSFRERYPLAYDGTIASADAAVGELLDGLKRLGRYDRAVVVLLSDHGEGLGDHGEAEHGILLYREALHVPLLLKLPGALDAGRRVGRAVGLVDVVPTVLGLVGAPLPTPLDGRDLLAREDSRGPVVIYGETSYPRIHLGWSELRSVVDDRYHYIDGPRPELYDVVRDPGEASPLPRPRAARMAAALQGFDSEGPAPPTVGSTSAERLRSLGYLSGVAVPRPPGEPGSRPNPRDNIATYEEIKSGFRLVREGNDEQAVAVFRRLLSRWPALFDVEWELGASLARLGRPAEAAAAFERAMRLSPPLAPSVALSLAEVQLQLGRLDGATISARAAVPADPARAHALLARTALARGDLAAVEQEAALSRGDAAAEQQALLTRTEARVRAGRLLEAMALLDGARQEREASGRRAFRGLEERRGDVLARLGRNDEAAAAFRKEIAGYPGNSQAYANLAVLLATMGRPREGVRRILDEMVRARPGPRSAALAAEAGRFLDGMDSARARHR
jgi:choline-sulfatase